VLGKIVLINLMKKK